MINSYEELLVEYDATVTVVEKSFKSEAKGLCKGNKIGISNKLATSIEKRCVLAEELGHFHLTVGDITNLNKINNVKQEVVARRWAHKKILPLCELTDAVSLGINCKYELIDHLNVTEEFFNEAIEHYKQTYGTLVHINSHLIMFEPTFNVIDFTNSSIDAPL